MDIKVPRTDFELSDFSFNNMQKEEKYDLCFIHDECVCFNDFSDISITTSKIKNCRINDNNFNKGTFVDVVFDCCDLSNCDFTKCFFRRVEFKNCKMLGTIFALCHFQDVTFSDNNAQMTNFTGSKFEKVSTCNTNFSYSSFDECSLNLIIKECNFTSGSFARTPLKDVDFSDSIIDDVKITAEDLKGAIVSSYQAMEFSKLLGLIIK